MRFVNLPKPIPRLPCESYNLIWYQMLSKNQNFLVVLLIWLILLLPVDRKLLATVAEGEVLAVAEGWRMSIQDSPRPPSKASLLLTPNILFFVSTADDLQVCAEVSEFGISVFLQQFSSNMIKWQAILLASTHLTIWVQSLAKPGRGTVFMAYFSVDCPWLFWPLSFCSAKPIFFEMSEVAYRKGLQIRTPELTRTFLTIYFPATRFCRVRSFSQRRSDRWRYYLRAAAAAQPSRR